VLILPFAVHAENDLSFLQRGIREMLATRLADAGKVSVLEREVLQHTQGQSPSPADPKDALVLAGRLGADYVVMGSLTLFGESISTDALFLDVARQSVLVTLDESGRSRGEAIQHVSRFADQVNATVFGRRREAKAAFQPDPKTAPAAADHQRHPEEVWHSQGPAWLASAGKAESGDPGGTLWKSRRFDGAFWGIAIGDLDGDQRQETALLGEGRVTWLRHTGQHLETLGECLLPAGLHTLAMDAADINGNGRDELFVSAVGQDYRPASVVLEWSPVTGQLVPIQTNVAWFLRVVACAEHQQRVLLGQRGGRQTIFMGEIQELTWIDGGYAATARAGAPAGSNVFGIGFGDLMGNGQRQSVHVAAEDRLQLTGGGAEQWSSSEPYGGSTTYLVAPDAWEAATRLRRGADPLPQELYYLPQRLIVADVNGDGKQDLLAVQNHDGFNRIFTRTRVFRQGRFSCLEWDQVGLTPRWRTRNFSGYISDFTWADIDNDGRRELAFVVVAGPGMPGLGGDHSNIVVWKHSEAPATAHAGAG
jgi:TolB-like protein